MFFNAEGTETTEERKEKKENILAMERTCPICKTETDPALHPNFPFCSERCRLQDLGNWASEKYVVSEPVFDEEEPSEGGGKTIVLDLEKPNDSES